MIYQRVILACLCVAMACYYLSTIFSARTMQGNGRGNANILKRRTATTVPHEAEQFGSYGTEDVQRDVYCGAKGQPWKTFIHRFVLTMDDHIIAGDSLGNTLYGVDTGGDKWVYERCCTNYDFETGEWQSTELIRPNGASFKQQSEHQKRSQSGRSTHACLLFNNHEYCSLLFS